MDEALNQYVSLMPRPAPVKLEKQKNTEQNVKNRECSLFGVFVERLPHNPTGDFIIGPKMDKLQALITYIQGQDSLVRSYGFTKSDTLITNYYPSSKLLTESKPPLLQHIIMERRASKDSSYRHVGLTAKQSKDQRSKDFERGLFRTYHEELKLYQENIVL